MVSGRRPATRVGIPREFALPKALADIINGFGLLIVQGGWLKYCPPPEADPEAQENREISFGTHQHLQQFTNLNEVAVVRKLIRPGYILSVPTGTGWWMLSARTAFNVAEVAENADNVKVVAVFKEWTPADAIYCGIVQRGNTGLEGDSDAAFKWSTGDFFGMFYMLYLGVIFS
ncbi:unnamed protein product [Bemisia tabaci]|uniref:Uncharacterized protein n=1 Tax=Bemisia tabaci TaxID=7038 RepID=A0A9P0AAP8_BEMTA|nr:unnamed protein product [Bemisia tabaci]